MDDTGRKITKIAREVSKFTVQMMKEEGIGVPGMREEQGLLLVGIEFESQISELKS